MLTDQQQRELVLLASIGCDRQTGCNYVGCTPGDLLAALRQQASFAAQLLRAEATPEATHMRCVHDAAKDVKNWRASVWWLERRAPERFARRASAGLSAAELQGVVDQLCETIGQEIADVALRERVGRRLRQIAADLTCAYELPGDAGAGLSGIAAGEVEREDDFDPLAGVEDWQP
ncbi:MAG: hypothetical protein KF688_09030 [Pirellulales bacterium]|nr:hypothetical protein [Pirellulales bacterium]